MLSNRQQVLAVSGHENVRLSLNRTRKDQIIIRVARYRLGLFLGCWNQLDRKIDKKLLDPLPAGRLETQLLGEDPLQLDHHWLGQDEL